MIYIQPIEYTSKNHIYTYVKDLGMGYLSKIALVREKQTQKLYALKIINKENMEECGAETNIEREILIQMKMNHKNIVKLLETFEDDYNIYLLLEYCSGGTLHKKMIDEIGAFHVFYQILCAIDYLHSKNIIHRDIKPDNILIHEDGTLKLCDFGWAINCEECTTFELCGSNIYRAPEIELLQPYNCKVDIWSLGIVIYELLHGHTQFIDQMNERLNQDLQILLLAMLSKPVNQRPSCKQVFQCRWMRKMMKEQNLFNKYENEMLKNKINKNVQIKTLGNSCFDLKYKSAQVSETSSLTQSNQSAPPMIPNSHQDLVSSISSVPSVEDPAQPQQNIDF